MSLPLYSCNFFIWNSDSGRENSTAIQENRQDRKCGLHALQERDVWQAASRGINVVTSRYHAAAPD